MEMIGKKARVAAVASAVGLMAVGCETKPPIDVEVVPEQEAAMINEITALTVELQKKRTSLQNGEVLRGVHPKSHGCVAAEFTVNDDIGSDYRVGLFEQPGKRYKAMIRYSNAAVLAEPDLKDGENGSRGMAIKVLGVNGPIMLTDGGARNQDFLMVNTPEFAFANVRDYRRLSRVLNADEKGSKADRFFVPAKLLQSGIMDISGKLKPPEANEPAIVMGMRQILKTSAFEGFSPEDMEGTLLSLAVVQKIKQKTVRNPLEVQYFSAAPFRFGPDRVMKFSVARLGAERPQPPFSEEEKTTLDPNYLALALKKTMMRGETIHLSFKVQVVEASDLKAGGTKMIENAALAWSEEKHPFVEVATIEIKPVEEKESKNFVDACKSLQFTPWHALAAHEPLGGINRLRKPVYCKSAEFRLTAAGNENQVLCEGAEYN